MSYWGATVITSVRGRKVLKINRFRRNNFILNKSIIKLSSFQTLKRVLWELRRIVFNDKQNKPFVWDVNLSTSIKFAMYLTKLSIVKWTEFLSYLRETITNFWWTYATAIRKMTNHTKAEPIKKAEGRFDIIQKRIAWKINKYILVHNSYFVKKEARLFNTFQQTKKIYKIISIKINIDKKWNNRLFSSGLSKVKNTTYFYKTAIKTDSLYKAFKSIKEQNVPGIDGHTKATFSKQLENSIVKLNKDLRSHKYQPSPIKTIYISRPNGGKRSLGVSSLRDKIVQATLKHEVEKIYEPIFKDCSYGFRPKLSSHSALKQIKKTWQLTKWLILLDISKCFDSANKQVFYTSNPF